MFKFLAGLQIYLHLFSFHIINTVSYNNLNYGIGITNNKYAIGYIKNSFNNDSIYAGYMTKHWVFGIATGYNKRYNNIKSNIAIKGIEPIIAYRKYINKHIELLINLMMIHTIYKF